MDKLSQELSACACEYLNHADERNAKTLFMNEIREISANYKLSPDEIEDRTGNLPIRCFRYGDMPDNFSYFPVGTSGSDIIDMIDDTFAGDYGDEYNSKIDNFIENLKKNPDILEKDFAFDDPVSGVIECETDTFANYCQYCGWPFEENRNPQM